MTQTVVYDQHENTKAIMNAVNSFARHCKIGKVTRKSGVVLQGKSWEARLLTYFPDHWIPAHQLNTHGRSPFGGPLPGYMPKCGCKIGNACGNAACPHSMRVTC